MNSKQLKNIQIASLENRIKILDMVNAGQSGHVGGAFSAIDIITYLCMCEIDYNAATRSRFLLSKGHAVPALYAALNSIGRVADAELSEFRKIDSRLQGHTNLLHMPDTDFTSGLLGQGISYGVGIALAKKLKQEGNYVYVMVGDGEMHEGQIWEALMEAGHYKLDNLVLIVDRNGLCSHQPVENVMSIEPLKQRMESFGWYVTDIDGHDLDEISSVIVRMKSQFGKPKCIIAHTTKGKGVSFMENNGKWHRSVPNPEEYSKAKDELMSKLTNMREE